MGRTTKRLGLSLAVMGVSAVSGKDLGKVFPSEAIEQPHPKDRGHFYHNRKQMKRLKK